MAPGAVSKFDLIYLLNTEELPAEEKATMPASPVAIRPRSRPSMRGGARKPRARRFVCEACEFAFYTNSDLQKHITSVHLQLRPFGCTMCDKKFGEKSNATKHFKSVHERQRNAACTQCDAIFAFRDGLARHVRLVHDGVRSFQCPEPGCSSAPFKQGAHLKKHIQTVHKLPSTVTDTVVRRARVP